MKFIPLYDRVLVKVLEGTKEVGDFVLPDNARDDFLLGSVVAVGEGYRRDNGELMPLVIQPGMTVCFGPHAGTKVQISGEEYLNMREGEIIGRLEQ